MKVFLGVLLLLMMVGCVHNISDRTSLTDGSIFGKMAWAFYFPWYSDEYWKAYQFKDQPAVAYVSHDTVALSRHIRQAKSAGIDGFLVVWGGPHVYQDRNIPLLLNQAQKQNFRIAIYLESWRIADASERQNLYAWLHYVITAYKDHPAYMKLNGKPVIGIYAAATFSMHEWKATLDRLKEQNLEAFYIGDDLNLLPVFDGYHTFAVFMHTPEAYRSICENTAAVVSKGTEVCPKLWAATVQPGDDERLIPGRGDVYRVRGDGSYYQHMFESAIASNPDWVFITSWNEWPEHSYIEPSKAYGDLYLVLTRTWIKKWKEAQ